MPLPNVAVLGVRFDIDRLQRHSAGNYAETAWTIVWQALDPALIGGSSLWHGDTAATLGHRENVFCIAIQNDDSIRLMQARSILAASSDLGGVAAVPLFVEGKDVAGEPLPGDGHVDASGEIVGQSFHARPALLRARPARAAAPAAPNEVAGQGDTQTAASADQAPAQSAADAPHSPTLPDAPTSVMQTWAEAAPSRPLDPNAPQNPQLTFGKLFFSFDGRIGNGAYFAGMVLPLVAFFAVALVGGMIVASAGPSRGGGMGGLSAVLIFIAVIFWLWIHLAVAVKRFHDMDFSGAMVLLLLIPYLNFLIALWLLFGSGTEGQNRWGFTMRMR